MGVLHHIVISQYLGMTKPTGNCIDQKSLAVSKLWTFDSNKHRNSPRSAYTDFHRRHRSILGSRPGEWWRQQWCRVQMHWEMCALGGWKHVGCDWSAATPLMTAPRILATEQNHSSRQKAAESTVHLQQWNLVTWWQSLFHEYLMSMCWKQSAYSWYWH